MKSFGITCLSLVVVTLVGCGRMYPFSVQRDLQRADDARKASADENTRLNQQNQTYVGYLKSIYVTDNYNWILADAWTNYATAEKECSAIEYSLPDQTQMDELVTELYNKKPDWQQGMPQNEIHVKGVTMTLDKGYVFCVRQKN